MFCALPGGCNDLGSDGQSATVRVMAYVLSGGLRVIDRPLIETAPKKAFSTAATRGISSLCAGLDAESGKLSGPLKADTNVDAALRAAMLQLAAGDDQLARETAKLIGSDELLKKRLAALVRGHFGFESSVLKV
jgi:hypothetical protein